MDNEFVDTKHEFESLLVKYRLDEIIQKVEANENPTEDELLFKIAALTKKGLFEQALHEIANLPKIDNPYLLAKSFAAKAHILSNIGSLNEAIDLGNQSLAVIDHLPPENEFQKKIRAFVLFHLGTTYLGIGDVKFGETLLRECLELSQEIDDTDRITNIQTLMAVILMKRGDLEGSITINEELIDLYKSSKNLDGQGICLVNMANTYFLMNKNDQAISSYESSIKIFRTLKNNFREITTLSTLIELLLYNSEFEKANTELMVLEKFIAESEIDQLVKDRVDLTKALVLKFNPRTQYKVQAQILFENFIDSSEFPESNQKAKLHLIDLLIDELATYGNPDVLDEINEYVNDTYEEAKTNNLIDLHIEILILKSKISLVNYDFDDTKRLLEEASQMAEEKGYLLLAARINSEQNNFVSNLPKWKSLAEEGSSLRERVRRLGIQDYLKDVLKYQI